MSYILDALKRADAERERGAVPGLHARQVASPAYRPGDSAQRRVWLAAAATLALAGMAAAGLWLWQAPGTAVRLAAVEPAVPTPASTPPVPQAQPAPAAMPAPAPVPAPPPDLAAPRPARVPPPAAPPPAPRPAPPPRAAAVQAPPSPKSDARPKAAPGQTAPPAVRLLGDLPEELRRQIPPLAITGSVYSDNPDKRLLLVNNQVLPQGSLAAPGLKLELIQAKSSVFSFQGTRFRVPH